jgi:hypothetical protein
VSKRNFTDDQIEIAVRDLSCRTIASVIRKLGGNAKSGTRYHLIHKVVKDRNLDTSHWLGVRAGSLRKGQGIKPILPFLRLCEENESFPSSHIVKLRLIRDGLKKRECESCQLDSWMGFPIPIELHHKNGNNRDFRLQNLQIICPNCHALTPNRAGKGKRCVAQ